MNCKITEGNALAALGRSVSGSKISENTYLEFINRIITAN